MYVLNYMYALIYVLINVLKYTKWSLVAKTFVHVRVYLKVREYDV